MQSTNSNYCKLKFADNCDMETNKTHFSNEFWSPLVFGAKKMDQKPHFGLGRIGGNLSHRNSPRRSHQRGWRASICAVSSDSPLSATQSRFCLRKPSRRSSLTHEIDVAWARASAPQNTEQERRRNQAISRPPPRQCLISYRSLLHRKQVAPYVHTCEGA